MLYENMADYLVRPREEPFMITSFDVRPEMRSAIPAVVHVDGTARPQTVRRDISPRYHDLIRHFGTMSGHPVVLNTSFNVKGEPIVCNPREAIKCFFDTGLDVLVMGSFLIRKPVGA
jgi:carbamoyltransferase